VDITKIKQKYSIDLLHEDFRFEKDEISNAGLFDSCKRSIEVDRLGEHPVYATFPSSPNPFSQKREKGRPIQSPSPDLGEGFRVRVTQMGCSPMIAIFRTYRER
jgi:hypothetical protein